MRDAIRVAAVDDAAPGEALVLPTHLRGTPAAIALFRDDDGTYYALDDTCSHEDASLADGWVEAGEVECPLHATRFCLADGKPMCLPATKPVRTPRVEVHDGDLYLFPGTPAGD